MARHYPKPRPRLQFGRREALGPDITFTPVTLDGELIGSIVGRPEKKSIRRYTVTMLGIVIATRFDYSSAREALIEEWERHQ